jgi:starvation-inducible DNA-binding protein
MNDIISQLRLILALSYHMYYKAHSSHWNVEGINFPQYHDFFGEIYEAVFASIDTTAEYIRVLGAKAPATLMDICDLLPDDSATEEDSVETMLQRLNDANALMIFHLKMGIEMSGRIPEYALQNYFQDRLAYHQKIGWQISASLK